MAAIDRHATGVAADVPSGKTELRGNIPLWPVGDVL